MIIINQPSYTMWFFVWTKKWQWWELVCITKQLNIFVWNIVILLNMILPLCPLSFTCFFIYLDQSLHDWLLHATDFFNSLTKLTSGLRVPVYITICMSYPFSNVSFTVDINCKRNLFRWHWGHILTFCNVMVHWFHGQ